MLVTFNRSLKAERGRISRKFQSLRLGRQDWPAAIAAIRSAGCYDVVPELNVVIKANRAAIHRSISSLSFLVIVCYWRL